MRSTGSDSLLSNAKQTENANANPTQDRRVPGSNGKQTEIQRKNAKEFLPESITKSLAEKPLQVEADINTCAGAGKDANANPTQNTNAKQTKDANANSTLTRDECISVPDDTAEYPKSEFITAISEKVDERGCDERFVNPLHNWPPYQAERIGKINMYLRCLLENTLKLSRYRNIPVADLLNLVNAYIHVLYSEPFEKSGHPYSESLKSLNKRLSGMYKSFRNGNKLRLVLRWEEKVEIISMLHEIGNTVPLYKFSELFHAKEKYPQAQNKIKDSIPTTYP